MRRESEIKELLRTNGIKFNKIAAMLGIDSQKFHRWSEDDHPNNKVLKAAVKFVLRCMLETDQVQQKKMLRAKTAEIEFRERMDALGL